MSALDMVLVWGGAITIVSGIAAIIWRGVRATIRLGRRVDEFMDDWAGEEGRPGVPGRPGVVERVSGIEERLARVEHELYPNSGGSLRDAVDLANARLAQLLPDEEEPTVAPGGAPASP